MVINLKKTEKKPCKHLTLVKKILIATDISARGIDVPDIDFVINYDLPESSEIYIHRVGRTGRAGKRGTAISFCSKGKATL